MPDCSAAWHLRLCMTTPATAASPTRSVTIMVPFSQLDPKAEGGAPTWTLDTHLTMTEADALYPQLDIHGEEDYSFDDTHIPANDLSLTIFDPGTGRFLALLEPDGGDTNDTDGRAPIDPDDPFLPSTRGGVLRECYRQWPLDRSHPHVSAATHYRIDPRHPAFDERKLTLELSVHREAAPAHITLGMEVDGAEPRILAFSDELPSVAADEAVSILGQMRWH